MKKQKHSIEQNTANGMQRFSESYKNTTSTQKTHL